MHTSPPEGTPQHEADARSALDAYEKDINDMRVRASETSYATPEERDLSLLSSGFVYGWIKSAATAEANGFTKTIMFDLFKQAVGAMDQYLIHDSSIHALETVRNSMAAHMASMRSAAETQLHAGLRTLYGRAAADALRVRGAITDAQAFDIGAAVHGKGPMYLAGFAMFSQDPSLECKCLVCCASRVAQQNVTEEDAEAAIHRRFEDRYSAILAMGRWFHEMAAKESDAALDHISSISSAGPVDSTAAAQVSHSLLDSLRLKGKP